MLCGVLLEPVHCRVEGKGRPIQGAEARQTPRFGQTLARGRCHGFQHRSLVDSSWQYAIVSPVHSHAKPSKILFVPHRLGRGKRGMHLVILIIGNWCRWKYYEQRGELVDIEGDKAFEIGLRTWAHWVDRNVDHTKTTVFFRSISPEHKR